MKLAPEANHSAAVSVERPDKDDARAVDAAVGAACTLPSDSPADGDHPHNRVKRAGTAARNLSVPLFCKMEPHPEGFDTEQSRLRSGGFARNIGPG